MFDKVLIANRGAIATRIIRTLNHLGVASVAVYSEADSESRHVHLADEAWLLGEGGASNTYLDINKLLDIAKQTGAQAIHPGYGFLSENQVFVQRCEEIGIAFIGPTSEQIEAFGLKHRARELAEAAQVPLVPGSGLLSDLNAAHAAADRIGYPVMLKSTAGGGGIGMQRCFDVHQLNAAYESVKRLGSNNFANDGVFVEKFIPNARHIEVQVFGDGQGGALALGERDCSSQRRHQKVIEECPAPGLTEAMRVELLSTAERLLSQVNYRNAGTVEFIYDADAEAFYFLEVNTRLQVEHGVTEEVYGVDLVEWMLRLAAGDEIDLESRRAELKPQGHAIQARIYAEDPYLDFKPAPGLLSLVEWPDLPGLRIDHWIETGIEIPPFFDPMLGKMIVHETDRSSALQALSTAIQSTRIYGTETNLGYLSALLSDPVVQQGKVTTSYLNDFSWSPARVDVIKGGTQTTVQDWPGRQGYWDVGVPPSGPFDSLAFRLGNRLLGNESSAAGLEIIVQGPALRFSKDTWLVLTGATIDAKVDDEPVNNWQPFKVGPGQLLSLGRITGPGARSYLLIQGGLDCPDYLASKATFTLGRFGGHNGRELRAGDVLHLVTDQPKSNQPNLDTKGLIPEYAPSWSIRVIYGPHGAPDFFTDADIETFFGTDWEVHYNSSRTGVRLIGPKPQWARPDGGEAGLHPSNIHDNAYAFGSVDFTGDMPVILGPDGPSLGGFVCPATVISADLWKLGQLRPGDKIRFIPVDQTTAVELEAAQNQSVDTLNEIAVDWSPCAITTPVLDRRPSSEVGEDLVYRAAGDHFMLVEYGPNELSIPRRFRVHALMQWLHEHPLEGLRELTPGIRSLQLHYDSQSLTQDALLAHLQSAEIELAQQLNDLSVPSRIVHLPLSWDDAACRLAIEKYMQSVRADAPWCPSNLEFIRRINGLESIDEVKRILFEASYLVMGLGDVYLGAPVATPVDPRHRLVTTKYNPARTWTAENSVGIGGAYLCVYGMEGPGGYQFVGRTLQMWNRWRQTHEFEQPWLLRFFDQIRFYPVSAEELHQIRRDFPAGRYPLRIEQTRFSLADYQAMLSEQRESIEAFYNNRDHAFEAELERWHQQGLFNFTPKETSIQAQAEDWPEDQTPVESPVSGSVWRCNLAVGDRIEVDETLMILESMKMEIDLPSPTAGTISRLLVKEGDQVQAGQVLMLIEALV